VKRPGATVGIISLGGCDPAVREATDILARQGNPVDYMRIRAFPFGVEVEKFLAEHDYCYIVEQNRDAQLRTLLMLETSVSKEKLLPVLIYGGFPLSAKHVLDAVEKQAKNVVTSKTEELDAVNR